MKRIAVLLVLLVLAASLIAASALAGGKTTGKKWGMPALPTPVADGYVYTDS